jgi:hypothetical protein
VDPGYDRNMGDTTYSFAACLEFGDEQGLIDYLRHPLHERLGQAFWRCCERSTVTEVRTVDIGSSGAQSELAR